VGWKTSVRVLSRIGRALGDRHIPGGRHEIAELADGDRVLVQPESVDLDAAYRAFLGIELRRSHQEGAAGHPRHVRRRRPAGIRGRVRMHLD